MEIRFLILLHLVFSIHFVNEYKYIYDDYKSLNFNDNFITKNKFVQTFKNIKENNPTLDKLTKSLCNYEMIDNYELCLVTFSPCGDINDYDKNVYNNRKHLTEFMDQINHKIRFGYEKVLNYSDKLNKVINQFKFRAEKDIEKKNK